MSCSSLINRSLKRRRIPASLKTWLQRLTPPLLLLFFSLPVSAQNCPDLSTFNVDDQPDWKVLERQLGGLMSQCLESSEFFALYGAAQLNSGNLAGAAESLERALLIDPDNGAAQIDYAQALFDQGQLFPALEINEQLLQRTDLPGNLQPALASRQQSWQALTRQRSFQADLLTGYDNNLNGAPDSSLLALTLSGDPVLLEISPEFRPVSGPYLNMRLAGRYRQLAPDHQHNWTAGMQGRLSEDSKSDLLQLTTRYAFIRPDNGHSWQLTAGSSHLFFGGSALFSGTEAGARYQAASESVCKPYYELTTQHQLYHQQSLLNAFESKASAGVNCPLNNRNGGQQITAEFSLLNNAALKSGRLGGDRDGWQFNLDWQYQLPRGVLRAQVNHTQIDDRQGYSPLLANGAKRSQDRSSLLLQYREPLPTLGRNATLLINVYHQQQQSNISLFETLDSSAEIGLSWGF